VEEESGVAEAKVVGVLDKIETILGGERRHANRSRLKVVDEALTEACGEVGGEIGTPLVSLDESRREEVSKEGPSPSQRTPIGNGDG
jgi:hypothetical protein